MDDITLGLDVGTTSIGWALINKTADKIIDAGVRIFSNGREPKGGSSLAVTRRDKRGQRRRRDRYLKRRKRLSNLLVKFGFLPSLHSEENARLFREDPYELRSKALDEAITPLEMGRVIFHLNQRRGFKSNRKSDAGEDEKEAGKIKTGARELHRKMEASECKTLGDFLYKLPAGQSKRARIDSQNAYPFYPQRQDIEDEFDILWERQKRFHPKIYSQQAHDAIKDALLYQRPLRPVDPGNCVFLPQEERLSKAHPLFQQCRLYEEVNALRIIRPGQDSRPLSREERDKLIDKLTPKKEVTFKSLGKAIKLLHEYSFNKDTDNRSKLLGDEVNALMSKKEYFGNQWQEWDWQKQAQIIGWLQDARLSDEQVREKFLSLGGNLDEEHLSKIINVSLPEGYGKLGLTATKKILEELKGDVIVYSDAVTKAGWNHSDFNTGEIFDELPYYGEVLERDIGTGTGDKNDPIEKRFGKIPNPTVHIGLRQVGKLVNAVIKRYGKPTHIAVELARELPMGQKRKSEHDSKLRKLTQDAERRGKELVDVFHQTNNGKNRARLKLWEEQKRKDGSQHFCPYCGETIGSSSLFSPEVEEDHILPFSRTLDNSLANRVVVHHQCNQQKKNRSPYEAFGSDEERWEGIADNSMSLPSNKKWRFTPDAMKKFDEESGFIARQLTDTQYLSKMVGKYLRVLYPDPKQHHEAVIVTPGHLTALLRRNWGLDSLLWDIDAPDVEEDDGELNKAEKIKEKNRNDHRHHAIDAVVIALTDRSTLNSVSRSARNAEDDDLQKLMVDFPEPWENFRKDLKTKLREMVISFKPDHGLAGKQDPQHDQTSGALLDETAWGAVDKAYFEEEYKKNPGEPITVEVATRIPSEAIDRKYFDTKKGAYIADDALRNRLIEVTEGLSGKAFDEALNDFFSESREDNPWSGLRHVRIRRQRSVIPIVEKLSLQGKVHPYKGYVGNNNSSYEVWETFDKRRNKKKWLAIVISTYQGNRRKLVSSRPEPDARLIMRLFKNDVVALGEQAKRKIMRVVKFSQDKAIYLAQHNEANVPARDVDKKDTFKTTKLAASSLLTNRARKLRVDMLGKVYDPSFDE